MRLDSFHGFDQTEILLRPCRGLWICFGPSRLAVAHSSCATRSSPGRRRVRMERSETHQLRSGRTSAMPKRLRRPPLQSPNVRKTSIAAVYVIGTTRWISSAGRGRRERLGRSSGRLRAAGVALPLLSILRRNGRNWRNSAGFGVTRARNVTPHSATVKMSDLDTLDAAPSLDVLRSPPGDWLKGDRARQLSIRVNDRWRRVLHLDSRRPGSRRSRGLSLGEPSCPDCALIPAKFSLRSI